MSGAFDADQVQAAAAAGGTLFRPVITKETDEIFAALLEMCVIFLLIC